MRNFSVYFLALFYMLAGVNHFWHPDFYYPLIPDYLPNHQFINMVSGVAEIVFGIGILFPATRFISCTAIIMLLILFIPSHIYFIQLGGCVSEGICVPAWVAWVRLIVVHPLLVYWAYSDRNTKSNNAISNRLSEHYRQD